MGHGATRERIMDVALRLFTRQGVAATTVTAIEAEAGLSPGSGSFYRHFAGKDQLLEAVVDRELERARKDPSAQLAAAPHGTPPSTALAAQLRGDLDFLRLLQPLIALLIWERDRAPDVAHRVRETMAEAGITLGIADLARTAPPHLNADPAATATVMQSAMIGYFLTAEYFGGPPADVDPDRFTTALAALLTGPAAPESNGTRSPGDSE
ncbi:TetR/AcrR family transcriptional regulator [Amycolatopsis sp. cmx-4-54]|uniref:TetR/AcrR family transcriptional regulator n=1 Tax=Amycolatopsis sp. cmx-4-54 TaxID=2790936 RepID=UPI00397D6C31